VYFEYICWKFAGRLLDKHSITGWLSCRYTEEEEGRVEVVLEGSDRIDSTWKEYNFRFKPGHTSDRLPIACKL